MQGHANAFPIVSVGRAVTDYRGSCRPACVGVRVRFRFRAGRVSVRFRVRVRVRIYISMPIYVDTFCVRLRKIN